MSNNQKTCKSKKLNKILQITPNKIKSKENNNFMNKDTKNNLNIHVMPPQISDADVNALFNGIIKVVKKKIELETKAEILTANLNLERVLKELKEKERECNRLKNEIVYLRSKLDNLT